MRNDNPATGIKTISHRKPEKMPGRLRNILRLDDFESAARKRLPKPIFVYYQSAVQDRITFNRNRRDFDKYGFVPRVLTDTSKRDQSVVLFGKRHPLPFGIAPMGMSALATYDGDNVLARVAAEAGIPSVLSAASLTPLEQVAATPGRWFQTYLPAETGRIEPMIDRVSRSDFDALVLTVDVPVNPNPENQKRAGFSSPLQPSLTLAWQGMTHPTWTIGTILRTIAAKGMPCFDNMDARPGPPIVSKDLVRNLGLRDGLTWKHLELIRRRWKKLLIVKGIIAAEDSRIAAELGVDGIIVSNHGGRQLDGTISSLAALPACVEAAPGIPVMLDSGVRRGGDVLKAYALGAAFVFVGRPFLFAAAVAGTDGVRHCIDLLTSEIDRDMALLGVNAINRAHLRDRIVPVA